MTRPLRSELANGFHHVTARGNRRELIFHGDADRHKFLRLLATVVTRLGWRLLNFCLMPNHYHLVVQTPERNLSTGMHFLNCVYARYLRARQALVGHLFQGRFHSRLIISEAHVMEVLRYVDLNPVRGRLCERPEDYVWSGHRPLTGLTAPGPLATAEALSFFGDSERYGAFVLAKVEDATNARGCDLWLAAASPWDGSFIVDPHAPRPALSDLIQNYEPVEAAGLAYHRFGYRNDEIAAALDRSRATISRYAHIWLEGE